MLCLLTRDRNVCTVNLLCSRQSAEHEDGSYCSWCGDLAARESSRPQTIVHNDDGTERLQLGIACNTSAKLIDRRQQSGTEHSIFSQRRIFKWGGAGGRVRYKSGGPGPYVFSVTFCCLAMPRVFRQNITVN